MSPKQMQPLPDWEQVLSAAARLQTLLPEAVLVGGTASAIHASHRFSRDADHVLTDLKLRFDVVLAEILRIKGVLILKRNATRDYLDFVALASRMNAVEIKAALSPFDALYPQPNEQSALQQLHIQLAQPMPFDLAETELPEYKNLAPQWHEWNSVKAVCLQVATGLFDVLSDTARASPIKK